MKLGGILKAISNPRLYAAERLVGKHAPLLLSAADLLSKKDIEPEEFVRAALQLYNEWHKS